MCQKKCNDMNASVDKMASYTLKNDCPTWAKKYPTVGSVCHLTGIG